MSKKLQPPQLNFNMIESEDLLGALYEKRIEIVLEEGISLLNNEQKVAFFIDHFHLETTTIGLEDWFFEGSGRLGSKELLKITLESFREIGENSHAEILEGINKLITEIPSILKEKDWDPLCELSESLVPLGDFYRITLVEYVERNKGKSFFLCKLLFLILVSIDIGGLNKFVEMANKKCVCSLWSICVFTI